MKKKSFFGMIVFLTVFVNMRVVGISKALPYVNIDVNTAFSMITNGSFPDLLVLDVRTKGEYDSGHIYRAVWIPHTELKARIEELAGHEDDEIIVYCGSGTRSLNASQTLDSFNFTRVYNMLGGIMSWIGAGYPTVVATVHNYDTALNYDTIQAAIDAPQTLNGHTINVDEGIYCEHLTVNKAIHFVGENKDTTIVDGTFNGTIFHVRTDNVSISNFTIRYSGCGVCGNGGVYIEGGCQSVKVENNQFIYNGFGIGMHQTTKVSVANNNLTNSNSWSILISESSDISIFKNTIAGNAGGINVESSGDVVVSRNVIFDSLYGIWMNKSEKCLVFGNDFSSNSFFGISTADSRNNSIFHNNFIENTYAVASLNSTNSWDNNIEGNYWSDYDGLDNNHDGIGDSWCEIDASNYDRYPLMGMFSGFDASSGTYVDIVSNSTISSFEYELSGNSINLVVSNSTLDQTFGFCRVTIPHVLISGTYHVTVNGIEPFYVDYDIADNGTHSWIYFEYEHSELEIVIVPEFPQLSILLPLMMVMVMAASAHRRRTMKRHS